jgi:hypothetical protein
MAVRLARAPARPDTQTQALFPHPQPQARGPPWPGRAPQTSPTGTPPPSSGGGRSRPDGVTPHEPSLRGAGRRAGRTLRARRHPGPGPRVRASLSPAPRPRAGVQAAARALTCSGSASRSAGGTRSAPPPPLSKPTAFSVKTMQRACAAPAPPPPDLPPRAEPPAPPVAPTTPPAVRRRPRPCHAHASPKATRARAGTCGCVQGSSACARRCPGLGTGTGTGTETRSPLVDTGCLGTKRFQTCVLKMDELGNT